MGFKRLEPEDIVVSADAVQSTLWSTGQPTLTSFFTSSIQALSPSGEYYLSVYQTASTEDNAAVQFQLLYADVLGSGSEYYNSSIPANTPSSTIYGQYRSLILEDENAEFYFGDSNNIVTGSHFWVISVDRARYKEKLFPFTFNMTLSGSGGELHLTNNSAETTTQTFIGSNRVYQIVSGSNGISNSGSGYSVSNGSYGLFFPDIATLLLNPQAVSESIGVVANRTANLTNGTNQATIFDSIKLGASFQLNSEETITADYIFVRARNSEFNYSMNPSYIAGSTGELIYSNFINNPQTYITTVGLYNDANELLAVAKLSRPIIKDFTKEILLTTKLSF
jgi:hypothetical protein